MQKDELLILFRNSILMLNHLRKTQPTDLGQANQEHVEFKQQLQQYRSACTSCILRCQAYMGMLNLDLPEAFINDEITDYRQDLEKINELCLKINQKFPGYLPAKMKIKLPINPVFLGTTPSPKRDVYIPMMQDIAFLHKFFEGILLTPTPAPAVLAANSTHKHQAPAAAPKGAPAKPLSNNLQKRKAPHETDPDYEPSASFFKSQRSLKDSPLATIAKTTSYRKP